MKTKFTFLLVMFMTIMTFAQNGINYKAVIKDNSGNVVANDLIQVQFSILAGATSVYQETHSPTTDANGMIILNIGQGTPISGTFANIEWSSDSHFLNVQINTGAGLTNMGTTQFKTVPYALSSGDKVWNTDENGAHVLTTNIGIGTDSPSELLEIYDSSNATIKLTVPNLGSSTKLEFENGDEAGSHTFYRFENRSDYLRFEVDTDFLAPTTGYETVMNLGRLGLSLETGARVNEFSQDGSLAGNSNSAVPTERAIKTYVDNAVGNQVIFKVRGQGFAALDIPENTTTELNFWNYVIYDTANAFNTTTKRFVAPEAGYYYLHAHVIHSNGLAGNQVRLSFNIDTSLRYADYKVGRDAVTDISGIFYLSVGQEVWMNLRNYSPSDLRPDGFNSFFEGYKIN